MALIPQITLGNINEIHDNDELNNNEYQTDFVSEPLCSDSN